MKTLHEKYGADLEIIALPCDQFGGQELGTDAAVGKAVGYAVGSSVLDEPPHAEPQLGLQSPQKQQSQSLQ